MRVSWTQIAPFFMLLQNMAEKLSKPQNFQSALILRQFTLSKQLPTMVRFYDTPALIIFFGAQNTVGSFQIKVQEYLLYGRFVTGVFSTAKRCS